MPFHATREASGVTVITVEGQLIVANRQELKEMIGTALEAGDRKFVLDFGPTSYIDSSGLGALVSISKKVRETGGELRLAALNDDLRSLFELTKLDTLFSISDSAAGALAGF
jgi:anti-sigma B factor antagonist